VRVEQLDRLLDGRQGVHVAASAVAGAVPAGGPLDPDEIAERSWQLHLQPVHEWEREVVNAGSH
jgi:hypothetical protein